MKNTEENRGGGKAVKIPQFHVAGTDFGQVKFTFCLVTPELAAEWLKANLRNRKLKERALETYVMDMRNDAWMVTAQCISFDQENNLTDGQHRLQAIVRAKRPVLMVISTGWPVKQGKGKTMDAVDRGTGRTIADQLWLQHDIDPKEAVYVVKVCNALAAACFGLSRVRQSTPDSVLAVYALYKAELKWLLENPIREHGLKQAGVAAALLFGRACWADKTQQFLERLMTGENLDRQSPILHLRNWLMGDGKHEDQSLVRQVAMHHLAAFVDGKTLPQVVVNSNAAYIRLMKIHKVRVEKVCAVYAQAVPEFLRDGAEPARANVKVGAISAEAVAVLEALPKIFTSTDLMARTDGNTGNWLMIWLNKRWISPNGPNQFLKAEGPYK